MSTCSIRMGEETIALSGPNVTSDELYKLLAALRRLVSGQDTSAAYYPSSQTVLIDVVQAETDRFALTLRHLNGRQVECGAARSDVERWIAEVQAILHVFPQITSQSPIGVPYRSNFAPDHQAPKLDHKTL